MKRGCLVIVTVVLAVYACLTVITQVLDENSPRRYGVLSVVEFGRKVHHLAGITNLVDFDLAANPFDGACRKLDLALPPNARIYMDQMLGRTNLDRGLLYHYMAYYLFPREIATSLNQPAQITRDGFVGRAAESREELLAHGFDVEVAASANTIKGRPLREDLPVKLPASPSWFPSRRDALLAFLLPLLTALSGLELLRFLFPALPARMSLRERLACGLGLGMMLVAALTLGIKLCGFHGRGLVLLATVAGAMIALWNNRREILQKNPFEPGQIAHKAIALVGGLWFVLVFIAAGVLGLVESDAVAAWMLKAKIFYHYTGSDIVRWCSEPRLAHGHFDYPALVPALHAATFDALGRLNENVTKFWPAWMLLLLVGALAALNRTGKKRFLGPSFFLLALILLPCMRLFTESEGGTMPMIFFTTLGFVECALAQVGRDRARLGLGLVLLFGAAMAKFEGFVFLGAAVFWTALLPWARPSLKASPALWRVAGFCLAAALPYCYLRARIPALFYESDWVHYALHHPWTTLSSMPSILLMMTARLFVSITLAAWSGTGGHLHWAGRWEGFPSLYHHATLGLAWLALVVTIALWVVVPARRRFIGWLLAVNVTILAGFSFVFASFVSTTDLSRMLDYYTADIASGRYLFPVLVAWSATVVTLLFQGAAELTPAAEPAAAAEPGTQMDGGAAASGPPGLNSGPSSPAQKPSAVALGRWSLAVNVGLLLVSLLLLAGLSEIVLRLFLKETLGVTRDERSLLYRYDPMLGWFPVANQTNGFVGSRAITVVNNSEGFRAAEHTTNSNPGILFLGDSFVWGYDVEAAERFTDKLQARHPEWNIYNLGVSGYGTDQELLLLDKYFEAYKPRIVFLVYCSDTDDLDNCSNYRYEGYYKPYTVVAGGRLQLQGVPVPKSERVFLAEHPQFRRSYLARLLVRGCFKLKGPPVLTNPNPTAAIILAMQQLVNSHGAILAVGLTINNPDLQNFLQQCNIPYVDLTTELRYSSQGFHWTPEGHTFVCDRIEEFLGRGKFLSNRGVALPTQNPPRTRPAHSTSDQPAPPPAPGP